MDTKAIYQMNKEDILNRMLKVAAKHTGLKRADLLDPLVSLVTESLAEEIYKVSDEINNIENRMLESISGILCPDLSLWAHPSHCILHATPNENSHLLSSSTSFVLKDKRHLPTGKNKLIFNPVCNTFIHKGGVRYLIYGGLCYSIDADHTKTLLFRSRNPHFIQSRSYWVVLDLDDAIEKLNNLSFYFDFPGVASKDEYLNLLQFTEWKLNNKIISLKRGMNIVDTPASNEVVDLFNQFSTTQILDENILKAYHKHYLTVEDEIILDIEKKRFPEELVNYFEEDLIQEFDTPLLWFEIILPQIFSAALTESLTVNINTFPVANKYLCSKTVNLDDIAKIIPLETGDCQSLLSVESVVDSKGRVYYELPFSDTEEEQYMTYTLRRGGYERYNKRDAREYLSNLTGLLGNYSSLDTNMGDDDSTENISEQVQDLLKHVNKILAELKDKLEVQSYIHIDRISGSDVFFIQYWVTDGEQANNIKQGAYFEIRGSEASLVDTASIFTLSSTIGAKQAPESADRQNLRMKSLTRKNILVTNQDIISFCKEELGSIIHSVDVRKGIMMSGGDLYSPFLRTTDVHLTLKQDQDYLLSNHDLMYLKNLLQKNSPATFNYRVFINNDK